MQHNPELAKRLKLIRQIAWVVIACLVTWVFVTHRAQPTATTQAALPITNVTQPFVMQTKTGKAFTEKDLANKPSMIFFGFTHCPSICPGALADMGIWLEKLGKDSSKLNAVFVSLDPERDTPARLVDYLKSYDKQIIGLTGTPEQVASIAKTYGIYYKKLPAMEGGEYMVDHSASIFLYDKDRQLISTIDTMESRDIAFAKIKKLIGQTP